MAARTCSSRCSASADAARAWSCCRSLAAGLPRLRRLHGDAEPLDGPLNRAPAELARECGVVLCGGRLVERSEHGLHNTAVLFDRDGRRLATYRKVHLLPYGSREAGLLEPGNEPVTAACEGTTI